MSTQKIQNDPDELRDLLPKVVESQILTVLVVLLILANHTLDTIRIKFEGFLSEDRLDVKIKS
jgi:hypothetical protein